MIIPHKITCMWIYVADRILYIRLKYVEHLCRGCPTFIASYNGDADSI